MKGGLAYTGKLMFYNLNLPYGGKLWRVQTLADLAENRPTANF